MDSYFHIFLQRQNDFIDEIEDVEDEQVMGDIISNYYKTCMARPVKVPDFPKDVRWIGDKRPSPAKFTIIDFFTYCCINCMQILPTLEVVDTTFPTEDVQVIGVHSAKFDNEKVDDNIFRAINRLGVKHPVVNDGDFKVWKAFDTHCWPTVILFESATKSLLLYATGEYVVNKHLMTLMRTFLSLSKNTTISMDQIDATEVPPTSVELAALNFPGGLSLSLDGDQSRLGLADSTNHRILVIDRKTGNVLNIVGSGVKGHQDGSTCRATFNTPQGLEFISDSEIIVADTNNHSLRLVDLAKDEVKTIFDFRSTSPSSVKKFSPWDVVKHLNVVFVSLAGSHQIWMMSLSSEPIILLGVKLNKRFEGAIVSGTGREENRNNLYPLRAAFAQPSGLAMSTDTLFIADSESSSIRSIDLKTGQVKNVVGGTVDPQNLFAFGDKDGTGLDVRLQHPIGVAYDAVSWNNLIVADTYNHKIKIIDIEKRACKTFDFAPTDVQLSEPSGVVCLKSARLAYFCDTNNHNIRILDLDTATISTLTLNFKVADECQPRHVFNVSGEEDIKITVNLSLGSNEEKLNDLALSHVTVKIIQEKFVSTSDFSPSFKINQLPANIQLPLRLSNVSDLDDNEASIQLDLTVFTCNVTDGTCTRKVESIPIFFRKGNESCQQIVIDYKI